MIHPTSNRSVHAALPFLAILAAAQGCDGMAPNDSETTRQSHQAAAVPAATDPVPCAAWADAVVANTGAIGLTAGTLVDSYQSNLGPYGGSNVGSAAILQAATTISANGGTIHGTKKTSAPAGFAVVNVPAGAKNLPLGASTPGTLSIGTAAQSITLAPGNYVAANINVSLPGAINVSPAGQVRIWVTGSLNLGGNLNANGVPQNLAFLVTKSGWVNVNSGALYGLVYAPTSNVIVSGSVYGTVIGSGVTINSGGAVHFDQSSACGQTKKAQLDQSFTSPWTLDDGLYGKPVLMAQTYTAGVTGTLQGVAIDVTSYTQYVARVQVESVVGGVPSNVVLGQAQASASGDLPLTTIIPFATAIPQVAGQQYAIIVDYPTAPAYYNGQSNAGSWRGSDGNAYAAGTMFTSWDNGTTWISSQSDGFDLHFQTYVIPN
jgi:hypothetical protein